MMVKRPFEYITGFYKENIFKIRWRYCNGANQPRSSLCPLDFLVGQAYRNNMIIVPATWIRLEESILFITLTQLMSAIGSVMLSPRPTSAKGY